MLALALAKVSNGSDMLVLFRRVDPKAHTNNNSPVPEGEPGTEIRPKVLKGPNGSGRKAGSSPLLGV